MSRLNATTTLFALSLPTQRDEESGVVERLGGVCVWGGGGRVQLSANMSHCLSIDLCLENIGEEKLEDLVNNLELKDYSVPTGN